MDIPGVPELKAILHRMLGSEPALRSLLPPGAASTVAINADEVAILQPTVTLALGAANNVNIRGFINTSAATAIAPTYIINPRRADGLRIEIPLVKPAIDPAYLALEVWKAAARTLTADPGAAAHVTTQDLIGNRPTLAQIEASTTLAKEATSQLIKTKTDAIPSNPLLTTDARLNNLDATVSSRLAAGSTVDSNVTQVTGKIVIGTGTASDPWRPQ
jgi:hypothetical protein